MWWNLLLATACFHVTVNAKSAKRQAAPLVSASRSTNANDQASNYWFANIKHDGIAPYNPNVTTYKTYRNVKDYGAKGDGVTDDTYALNNAIIDGYRCGPGCASSTTQPAVLYIPPGTYIVNSSLFMYYYTSIIGDATNLPTIKATADFFGLGILDSDPYYPGGGGANWYTNQNNFYREIRNLILDLTLIPSNTQNSGIHWQVAQATSLQNIVFNMAPKSPTNQQYGIFMDNGSGGFMTDLIFNGGSIGLFLGNQQFTTRNLTFNNCGTGLYMNWDWLWAFKSCTFNGCDIAIDMSQGGGNGRVQTVGSGTLQDSVLNNCGIGFRTTFATNSTPTSGGSFIMDNVDMTNNVPVAVADANGTTILAGNALINGWAQGRVYSAFIAEEQIGNLTCYVPTASTARIQRSVDAPPKPSGLLDPTSPRGSWIFERSKPQYENLPLSSFISVKDNGATGDGHTDDTASLQKVFDNVSANQVVFFPAGAYVIRETIKVPKNCRMVGEPWALIMVDGSSPTFADVNNPQPAWQVGQPGDTGVVEMSDVVFATRGPAPGAIVVQWNVADIPGQQGTVGMWDVHWRIGGWNGTLMQATECVKTPAVLTVPNPSCFGSFLLLHVTAQAQIYMENNWGWVSDHELDQGIDQTQIQIYNGRGFLIESTKPVWLYGTAAEHSMLYNYQLANAQNVYMSSIQTETQYGQSNPNALQPFTPQTSAPWNDPDFNNCYAQTCYKTFGLRIFQSSYVLVYGAGLYSFFNNYDSACILTSNCQEHMVSLVKSEGIYLYALNTVASTDMVLVDGTALVPALANANWFTHTVSIFEFP